MNRKKALEILKGIECEDGHWTLNDWNWTGFYEGSGEATLDGDYTVEKLEAIIFMIKESFALPTEPIKEETWEHTEKIPGFWAKPSKVEDTAEWEKDFDYEIGDCFDINGTKFTRYVKSFIAYRITQTIKDTEERVLREIRKEVNNQISIPIAPPTRDEKSYLAGWRDGLLNFRSGLDLTSSTEK